MLACASIALAGLKLEASFNLGLLLSMLAAYAPGTRLPVRVADGLPWVDATDWFALLWTVGAVVLGGLLLMVGLQMVRAPRE